LKQDADVSIGQATAMKRLILDDSLIPSERIPPPGRNQGSPMREF
jgi:hypothetical protein